MLSKQIKQLLDEYKNSNTYLTYQVLEGERIDKVLHKHYGTRALIYLKLFSYLNGIIYPFNELQAGDLVKIYNLDIFTRIAKKNGIDLTKIVYK